MGQDAANHTLVMWRLSLANSSSRAGKCPIQKSADTPKPPLPLNCTPDLHASRVCSLEHSPPS